MYEKIAIIQCSRYYYTCFRDRFIIFRQNYYSVNRQLSLWGKHSNITKPNCREKIIIRIIEVSVASYITYIVEN